MIHVKVQPMKNCNIPNFLAQESITDSLVPSKAKATFSQMKILLKRKHGT